MNPANHAQLFVPEEFARGVLKLRVVLSLSDPLLPLKVALLMGMGFAASPELTGQIRAASRSAAQLAPPALFGEHLVYACLLETPQAFIQGLLEMDLLKDYLPEVSRLVGVEQPEQYHAGYDAFAHVMNVVAFAARQANACGLPPEERVPLILAALFHDLGKGLTPVAKWPAHHYHEKLGLHPLREICARLRFPCKLHAALGLAVRQHMSAHKADIMNPGKTVRLIRRLQRFPGGTENFGRFLMADGAEKKHCDLIVELDAAFKSQQLTDRTRVHEQLCAVVRPVRRSFHER